MNSPDLRDCTAVVRCATVCCLPEVAAVSVNWFIRTNTVHFRTASWKLKWTYICNQLLLAIQWYSSCCYSKWLTEITQNFAQPSASWRQFCFISDTFALLSRVSAVILNFVRDKRVPVTTAWCVLRLRMEERPPVWRVAANILNKQSRTADKGWSYSLGVEWGSNNPSP
jgi:hypothetical protein